MGQESKQEAYRESFDDVLAEVTPLISKKDTHARSKEVVSDIRLRNAQSAFTKKYLIFNRAGIFSQSNKNYDIMTFCLKQGEVVGVRGGGGEGGGGRC